MKQKRFKSKEKITKVGVTGDTITGRGGLALFVRYLSSIKKKTKGSNLDIGQEINKKEIWG